MRREALVIASYEVGAVTVHRIIDWIGGLCPVQAEGTVVIGDKQYPWYFKSRGERMFLEVTVADGAKLSATRLWGIFPEAGYVTDEEAVAGIDELMLNIIILMESKDEG